MNEQTKRISPAEADEADRRRVAMAATINAEPEATIMLAGLAGPTYTTAELQEHFTVEGFMAPFVVVTRKSDGVRGSLMFTHSPRRYFLFQPA